MNTIFLDINDNFKNSDSTNKLHGNFINRKFLKFFIYKDILNNSLGKKIYIQFDIEYLYKSLKKENFTMRLSFLKYLINKEFTNNDTVNLVFSNFFDENQDIKDFIIRLLKQNSLIIYEEIKEINEMSKHDMIYIDRFIEKQNIKLNKLKILFVLNDIGDYNNDKIKEYLSKYKFLDILIYNNMGKIQLKKITKYVDDINTEYGTTIEIIQKKNISSYHVYVVFSKISKLDFIGNYVLRKNSLYIDLNNANEDILSTPYLEFERHKQELEVIFNRMNIVINDFSINKLGVFALKNYK